MASKYGEYMDDFAKVREDAWDLLEVITEDVDSDTNDWGKLGRVCERLEHVHAILLWNWVYPDLLDKIEDEKSRFIVQKDWNETYDKVVIPSVEGLLKISKQWKFNDYRIINFQNDLREWAQGMYDFLVKDASNQEDEQG